MVLFVYMYVYMYICIPLCNIYIYTYIHTHAHTHNITEVSETLFPCLVKGPWRGSAQLLAAGHFHTLMSTTLGEVCLCLFVYVCMYVCMLVCMYGTALSHTHVDDIGRGMLVFVCVCMCVCMYACMYGCKYTHTFTYLCTCIDTYIHTHTRTRTYAPGMEPLSIRAYTHIFIYTRIYIARA